jgi:hypothetical protein
VGEKPFEGFALTGPAEEKSTPRNQHRCHNQGPGAYPQKQTARLGQACLSCSRHRAVPFLDKTLTSKMFLRQSTTAPSTSTSRYFLRYLTQIRRICFQKPKLHVFEGDQLADGEGTNF